jgi:hypothetical protein
MITGRKGGSDLKAQANSDTGEVKRSCHCSGKLFPCQCLAPSPNLGLSDTCHPRWERLARRSRPDQLDISKVRTADNQSIAGASEQLAGISENSLGYSAGSQAAFQPASLA